MRCMIFNYFTGCSIICMFTSNSINFFFFLFIEADLTAFPTFVVEKEKDYPSWLENISILKPKKLTTTFCYTSTLKTNIAPTKLSKDMHLAVRFSSLWQRKIIRRRKTRKRYGTLMLWYLYIWWVAICDVVEWDGGASYLTWETGKTPKKKRQLDHFYYYGPDGHWDGPKIRVK